MVKKRKKVLIIGLVDSVHLGRWLKQFSDEGIDFYVFASKKYRRPHKLIINLTEQQVNSKCIVLSPFKWNFFIGYIDFFYFEFLGKLLKRFTRIEFLTKLLQHEKFDYIHAIELQGAGYLIDSLKVELIQEQNIIVTNWGSDIFYFKEFPQHVKRIRRLLSKANYYSAECERDYSLAREYGFIGIELPCIPNAGGFDLSDHKFMSSPVSLRKLILIKGYGGEFGRAMTIIPLLPEILTRFPEFNVHIYSVTADVLKMIKSLPSKVRVKIRITTNREPISHGDMLSEFSHSRVHIGCSASDGVSTAFLESLCTGAYPIQTNTSCASEWINLGVVASIVGLNQREILDQIFLALSDDQLVDKASVLNFEVARKTLDYRVVQKKALNYYE